jgi:hypothetical protein
VKKLRIVSSRQEPCAGGRRSHVPAPPWWNVRSARVFTERFVEGEDEWRYR